MLFSGKKHKCIDGGDDSTWPQIRLSIGPRQRSARALTQNGRRGSHGAVGVAVIYVARCVTARGVATDLAPRVGGFVKQEAEPAVLSNRGREMRGVGVGL